MLEALEVMEAYRSWQSVPLGMQLSADATQHIKYTAQDRDKMESMVGDFALMALMAMMVVALVVMVMALMVMALMVVTLVAVIRTGTNMPPSIRERGWCSCHSEQNVPLGAERTIVSNVHVSDLPHHPGGVRQGALASFI